MMDISDWVEMQGENLIYSFAMQLGGLLPMLIGSPFFIRPCYAIHTESTVAALIPDLICEEAGWQ